MSAIGDTVRRIPRRLWGFGRTDPEEIPYVARVTLWARWLVVVGCVFTGQYRADYGTLYHLFHTFHSLGFVVVNGYVHYLLRRRGTVRPIWLFGLSVMDVTAISFTTALSGGFNSPYFPLYYYAVAVFAWVFTSPHLVLPWTTLVVVVYVALSVMVEPGLDIAAKEERSLVFRVLTLYAVSGAISLITGFDRDRRRRGLERERELQRQRTEISQTIHDTSAQSAYMISLGIESAMELARGVNRELEERLRSTANLSRSAMWDLRHPINGGQIFEGKDLSQVLKSHVETFTAITSVDTELVQLGTEPPLSTITRSLLFSVAHNALTNALRHSQASKVTVELDFGNRGLRMSVSDDGIGLPEDYAERGHGFRNMIADAERMGGRLEVASDRSQGGTSVTCLVEYETD